jgi:hypothetical protein
LLIDEKFSGKKRNSPENKINIFFL